MLTNQETNINDIPEGTTLISPNGSSPVSLEMRTSSHTLQADQPPRLGGNDSGPAPYDFLHAGLGSCTAITIRAYAARKNIDLAGFSLSVSSRRDENKNLIIDKELTFAGNYSDEDVKKLVEVSKACSMHKDLAKAVEINTVVIQ